MCKKAAWIAHGEIKAIGDTDRVCDLYKEYIENK